MTANNPIVRNFNAQRSNSTMPFQQNKLISENVHVQNNLNLLLQQNKFGQTQANHRPDPQQKISKNNPNITTGGLRTTNINIIEKMLQAQSVSDLNNDDVKKNFKQLTTDREKAKKRTEETSELEIPITNAPYKTIIKDKIINKPVDKIKEDDLIVHKSTNLDADIKIFKAEQRAKKKQLKKINKDLDIEFHIDNYDKHKKKYEFKEVFTRNLEYDSNTCAENKQDYIEFYRKKQKEAEAGAELCDRILNDLVNTGLIKPEELPTGSVSEQTSHKKKSTRKTKDKK